jgi:hypothetical protein
LIPIIFEDKKLNTSLQDGLLFFQTWKVTHFLAILPGSIELKEAIFGVDIKGNGGILDESDDHADEV